MARRPSTTSSACPTQSALRSAPVPAAHVGKPGEHDPRCDVEQSGDDEAGRGRAADEPRAADRAEEHRRHARHGRDRVGRHQLVRADRPGERRSLGCEHEAGHGQEQEHTDEGAGLPADRHRRHGRERQGCPGQRHRDEDAATRPSVDHHAGERADQAERQQRHREQEGDPLGSRTAGGFEHHELRERDLRQPVGGLAEALTRHQRPERPVKQPASGTPPLLLLGIGWCPRRSRPDRSLGPGLGRARVDHVTRRPRPPGPVHPPTAKRIGNGASGVLPPCPTMQPTTMSSRRVRVPGRRRGACRVALSGSAYEDRAKAAPEAKVTGRLGPCGSQGRSTSQAAAYGGSWTASSRMSGADPVRWSTTRRGSSPTDPSTSRGTCRGSAITL